jgi:hypothetical protein
MAKEPVELFQFAPVLPLRVHRSAACSLQLVLSNASVLPCCTVCNATQCPIARPLPPLHGSARPDQRCGSCLDSRVKGIFAGSNKTRHHPEQACQEGLPSVTRWLRMASEVCRLIAILTISSQGMLVIMSEHRACLGRGWPRYGATSVYQRNGYRHGKWCNQLLRDTACVTQGQLAASSGNARASCMLFTWLLALHLVGGCKAMSTAQARVCVP